MPKTARRRTPRPRPQPAEVMGPTPEQEGKALWDTVKHKPSAAARTVVTRRNVTGWVIDRYLRRGIITTRQHAAAKWYREHWERGGYEGRLIASYGAQAATRGEPSAAVLPRSEAQLRARQALRQAGQILPPPLLRRMEAIVVHETEATAVGEAAGYSGKYRAFAALHDLRMCLSLLADWLRIGT